MASKCVICNRKITGYRYASRWRKIGLCPDCAPEHYKSAIESGRSPRDIKKDRKIRAKENKKLMPYNRLAYIFECNNLRKINRQGYNNYINGARWSRKSKAIRLYFGNRCQVCNSNGQLHAHHRTYDRLGIEKPEDITVLCVSCHNEYEKKRKAKSN